MIQVLYVDDEAALLDIGKHYLEHGGRFSVDIVDSAPAALELMAAKKYDAVISDYQMPGMDGIEFLKRVRRSGNTVPLILFTGRGREEVVIQALNEGADYYLQKGGDPKPQFAELSHKIRQAVQQRRAETTIRDHERREQDIINFLPDATFAIDASGIVIAWNHAMERMTGVPASAILGKGDYEYALPFYRERRPILVDLVLREDPSALARYPVVAREGRMLRAEIFIPHLNNGAGAWLWFTASPLFNDRGGVAGAIESIRDITGRVQAHEQIQAQSQELQASFEQITATEEELRQNFDELAKSHDALRASEEKYRRIVNTASEGIWAMDRDLRTTFVNQRMADIVGYGREEMLGRTVDSFMVAEELADHEQQLRERRRGRCARYERRFYRKDKTILWAEVSSTPLMTGTGEFEGSFAMVTDITGRKQAEEALRTKVEELNASYEQITAAEEELRQNYDELRKYQEKLGESEERYRTVFENTGTATVLIEEDTVIRIANDQFVSLAGCTREEIEGKKCWTDFVVPEDLDRMRTQHRLRREYPGNAAAHYEFRFVTNSGEIRDIFLTIGMVPGTRRSVASLLDITDRKRLDEETHRVAREWQRTFDATDDAIWILNRDQQVVRSNRMAGRMLGRPCREFIGKHCWELLHGTNAPVTGCPCVRARQSLRRETLELRDGRRWFEVSVDPMTDEEGVYSGAVHIVSDITDRKRTEEALRQANLQLSLLTSITRHDIGNQVFALLAFTDMLREESRDPALHSLIGKLESAAKTIRSSIELSKTCQDLGTQKPQWLEPEGIVQALPVPETVTLATADLAGIRVFADPMFGMVFCNLLDNSLRHGGKVATIRVSSRRAGGGLVLVWEDDGTGIPAGEKVRIFERGYGKNTGLGLFFVREILSVTGITITEAGEPGKGARFEIVVPEGAWRRSS